MTVRAKLRCESITMRHLGSGEVCFDATYDPTIPEDQRFQLATPWAHAKFSIDNPAALAQFKPGEYYYVDFSPVPKA